MPKLTLRDLFAVVTIAAILAAWWADRSRLAREIEAWQADSPWTIAVSTVRQDGPDTHPSTDSLLKQARWASPYAPEIAKLNRSTCREFVPQGAGQGLAAKETANIHLSRRPGESERPSPKQIEAAAKAIDIANQKIKRLANEQ
jgi:hypothetical protein